MPDFLDLTTRTKPYECRLLSVRDSPFLPTLKPEDPKNMAAYGGNIGDKGIEQEYVARKVIGSTEFQNKKRVERSEYRKVLGIELIREIILK
jgi:hypothetical protein